MREHIHGAAGHTGLISAVQAALSFASGHQEFGITQAYFIKVFAADNRILFYCGRLFGVHIQVSH